MSEVDGRAHGVGGLQLVDVLTAVCPIVQSAGSEWLDRLRSSPYPRQLVAELVTATDTVRIGELIPILDTCHGPAPLYELPARSRNCLLRAGVETWEQIRLLDLTTVKSFKNAGVQTQRTFVEWCLRHAENIVLAGDATSNHSLEVQADDVGAGISPGSVASPSRLDPLAPELSTIATLRRWLEAIGHERPSVRELLELLTSDLEQLPPDVAQAATELLSQSLDVGEADGNLDGADPVVVVRSLVGDGRSWDVWWARNFFGANAQPTLTDIGEGLDLTRERVRQLEKRVTETLTAAIEDDPRLESIRWRAHLLVHQLGSGVPLDAAAATSALADQSEEQAVALWRAGPYVQRNGWLVRKGEDPKSAVEAAIRGLPGPLIEQDELLGIMDSAEIPVAAVDNVVSGTVAIRDIGERCLVRWNGAIPDKAAVVLALLGRPATAEELIQHFLSDRSVTSVKNALSADDRFHRANMTEWALAEWGLEEYSGIVEEIIERIERDGGSTDTVALIEELVGLFGVSENSVRSYLGTPAFVLEGASARRRRLEEFKLKPKPLRHSRGVFQPSPVRLVTNFVIDRDLLRGSGRAIDAGLATQLALRPGDRLVFASPYQEVRFSWRPWSTTGPDVGSLGPAARALGGHEGDLLVVNLDLDGYTATFELVGDSLEGPERLRALTGLDDFPDMAAALASAIGVAPAEVRASLRSRGDQDLIALLPRESDAALEAQLDKLVDFL